MIDKDDCLYICYDTETNGYSEASSQTSVINKYNNIVQISAVYDTKHTFDRIVKVDYIPHKSANIHGITTEQSQKEGVSFNRAFSDFYQFIDKLMHEKGKRHVLLIAHNCEGFDKPILRMECERHSIPLPPHWYFFDTLPALRKQYKDLKSYRLGDVYAEFTGKQLDNAHNSLADSLALHTIATEYVHISSDAITTWDGYVFTDDNDSVKSIRFIGPKTCAKMKAVFQTPDPKVFHLRERYGDKPFEVTEMDLRTRYGYSRDGWIMQIMSEIYCLSPYDMYRRYKSSIYLQSLGLSQYQIGQLAAYDIHSASDFILSFVYQFKSNYRMFMNFIHNVLCKNGIISQHHVPVIYKDLTDMRAGYRLHRRVQSFP